ncbi:unnamed protein product [Zymoseptoria tritici ST99CH_1A5]|uniref:Uncharacterized protein n=3 Tax=Zymoseptoria tritici TaxID=1047171 RepID=A0A1X7S4L5_ZYMT9|nr:unnamed protein product [Zymoseptoria tritici ST99CH_3D7]SMR59060.1 unnamed protein product [Zymoseptoria tritici ST99CH_1E4]SMR62899.1 unnamed protein product [Zymoseptoria tritici ST99CH_3D1]SMY28270.1 unnamed protein product [Zymoseptoria tritici ST99CH_1A5]
MTGREDEANEASSSDESTDSLANARDSRATSIQAIPADRRRARQQSAQVKVKAQARLKKGYRDLLNTTIRELNPLASSVSAFATSQLGHVIWSSIEKEALFHQLSLKGAADLPALQKAVGSKSELQIRSYLLLLQEGRKGSSLTTSSRAEKQHVDPPSAFEISEDGEHTLNNAAHALSAQVNSHEEDQERQRYGEQWLIDEDVAEEMDVHYQQYSKSADSLEQELRETGNDDDTKSPLVSLDTGDPHLLRPSSFLQLSRSLFMNNSEDTEMNWHHLENISADVDQPAVYKSAIADLQNLTINITRRLVQATLFQAMSRLRAEDSSRKDWTPSAAVRQMDVRAAMQILNLPSSKTYWATAARRCKVQVYSESKKYQDGRPSTKNGRLLTHDEVEQEMGMTPIKGVNLSRRKAHEDSESERPPATDDMYTSEGSDNGSDTSDEIQEVTGEQNGGTSRKRARALSPESAAVAEDRRLERLDRLASKEEEQRIWELLGLPARDDLPKNRPKPPTAASPNMKVLEDRDVSGWREKLQYEAEWERPYRRVKEAEFERMELRRKRKRRRLGESQDARAASAGAEEVLSDVESVSDNGGDSDASSNDHDTSDNDNS